MKNTERPTALMLEVFEAFYHCNYAKHMLFGPGTKNARKNQGKWNDFQVGCFRHGLVEKDRAG